MVDKGGVRLHRAALIAAGPLVPGDASMCLYWSHAWDTPDVCRSRVELLTDSAFTLSRLLVKGFSVCLSRPGVLSSCRPPKWRRRTQQRSTMRGEELEVLVRRPWTISCPDQTVRRLPMYEAMALFLTLKYEKSTKTKSTEYGNGL